jgi:hypothetical protein
MSASPSEDDRVDPSDPRFTSAVAAIAATYFTEASVQTRRDVARELDLAGYPSAARFVLKRAKEIDAALPGRIGPRMKGAGEEPTGGMTREELLALPVSVDLMTAARALDMGRTTAHKLARTGRFPVKVLRVGNRYKVATADLLEALGMGDSGNET